jgi:hypothetical protein
MEKFTPTSWADALAAQKAAKEAKKARKGLFDESNGFVLDTSNVADFVLEELAIREAYENNKATGEADVDELGRVSVNRLVRVEFASGQKTYIKLDAIYVDQTQYLALAALVGQSVELRDFVVSTTYQQQVYSSTGTETIRPTAHWVADVVAAEKSPAR